jgi:hypothetical protein
MQPMAPRGRAKSTRGGLSGEPMEGRSTLQKPSQEHQIEGQMLVQVQHPNSQCVSVSPRIWIGTRCRPRMQSSPRVWEKPPRIRP